MKKKLYKTAFHLFVAMVFAAVSACSSEETAVGNPVKEEGETFFVIAEVARQVYTRAHDDNGYITGGIYCLAYLPASSSVHNIASVDFDKENGVGIVTTPDNRELKWIDVGGGATPTLYLDNVNSEFATEESTSTNIVFKSQIPYTASVFLGDEGKNDLLWGASAVSRGAKIANFELHHCMSRVRVQVTVDHTNETVPEDLSLEGATVSISNLVHTPESYNRLDGNLTLPNEPERKTLELVNSETVWFEKKSSNDNIEIYTTQDFVLPPQDLLTDANRPMLTIRLQNGKVYSGILPHAMEIEDGLHENPYPVTLSFLREHILTIRTVITEVPPELVFMPVKVVQWVDKGEFTIEAHQAGIYTAAEFYKLIEYYQANNEYQLVRYGRLVTDESGKQKWVFDFFSSVILEEEEIKGKMACDKNQADFSFSFNNYTNYIKNSNGEERPVDASELYRIVTDDE